MTSNPPDRGENLPESSPELSSSEIDLGDSGFVPRARRRRLAWLTGAVVSVAIVAGAVVLFGGMTSSHVWGTPSEESPDVAEETRPTVKTIRPRRDPLVEVHVEQLASVEAFYQSDLRARVSGLVRAVHKDIGDRVSAGELLIEVDVPDLEIEVYQKESMVRQRMQELRVARTKLKEAETNREVAETVIRQRQSEVRQAQALREFRFKRLNRFRYLSKNGAIPDDALEEQEHNFEASEAALETTKVAVEKANADLKDAGVKVEAAQAEIDLREHAIDVARKELDKARAIADYRRIVAPFDGVVVKRNVDPGSFVQNASTGQSETLITVARTDLVTVVARFPDNAAPFVSLGTPALVEIDEVPGLTIAGRITRFSPSIQNSDRTMRVEVDLYNEDEASYRRFARQALAAQLSMLAGRTPLGVAALNVSLRKATEGRSKGPTDPFPVRATPPHADEPGQVLLPGMTGVMKLQLGRFGNCHVLPSSAVFSRGGKPYILLVREGVTRQVPVRVQVNDGKIVKLSIVTRRTDAAGGTREVVQELTGDEEIVSTRQLEIGDGQPVKTAPGAW